MAAEELTEHGRKCLEHLKQAQALGVTVAGYAKAHGLKARVLYDAIKKLKKKGVIAAGARWHRQVRSSAESRSDGSESGFVSVRIERPSAGACPCSPVLRVQHVHGHVLEFGTWPPADVLAAVLSGGQ